MGRGEGGRKILEWLGRGSRTRSAPRFGHWTHQQVSKAEPSPGPHTRWVTWTGHICISTWLSSRGLSQGQASSSGTGHQDAGAPPTCDNYERSPTPRRHILLTVVARRIHQSPGLLTGECMSPTEAPVPGAGPPADRVPERCSGAWSSHRHQDPPLPGAPMPHPTCTPLTRHGTNQESCRGEAKGLTKQVQDTQSQCRPKADPVFLALVFGSLWATFPPEFECQSVHPQDLRMWRDLETEPFKRTLRYNGVRGDTQRDDTISKRREKASPPAP